MFDLLNLFYHQHTAIFGMFVLAFGSIVGSFLNVLIFRLPKILEQTWRKEASSFWTTHQKLISGSIFGDRGLPAPRVNRPSERMTTYPSLASSF